MKKALFLALVTIFVLSMTSSAFAAGWWRENTNDTINTTQSGGADNGVNAQGSTYDALWSSVSNDTVATSPHGGFSATTNKCKTCHAVHGALSTSFRLLKNTSRETECNYCHWKAAGASKYRLYAFTDLGKTVKGEHTLGSTFVPDAITDDVYDRGTYRTEGAVQKATLYCFSCHSVHGAGTITDQAAGHWTRRILRSNPGGITGYDANQGITSTNLGGLGLTTTLTQDIGSTIGVVTIDNIETASSGWKKNRNTIRASFCGGCHQKNFNFRYNNVTADQQGRDFSMQKGAHPMGTDGILEVGGGAGVSQLNYRVSWQNANWCGSCHAALVELGSTSTADSGAGDNSFLPEVGNDQDSYPAFDDVTEDWNTTWYAAGFPHQSESDKLLFDSVKSGASVNQDGVTTTNDAYRPLDSMDGVCEKCHVNGTFQAGGAYSGVGGNNTGSF